MVFPPCHLRTSRTCVKVSGHNTLKKSHATSPNPPSRLFDNEGAVFHCEDKQASSLRIYCPCLFHTGIENTFIDPSIFEPVLQDPTTIVTSLVDQLQKQHSKSYPWATGPGRQLPAGYPGQKEKGISKWAPDRFVRRLTFPSYAQHPGQDDFPTYPGGLSKPFCLRRCLHPPRHPEIGACRRRFDLGQSRSCWLLHQH